MARYFRGLSFLALCMIFLFQLSPVFSFSLSLSIFLSLPQLLINNDFFCSKLCVSMLRYPFCPQRWAKSDSSSMRDIPICKNNIYTVNNVLCLFFYILLTNQNNYPVFSVTWFFRNQSNMLIRFSIIVNVENNVPSCFFVETVINFQDTTPKRTTFCNIRNYFTVFSFKKKY